MVAAQLVCTGKCLDEGYVLGGGGVDFEGGGAGGGDDLGFCYSEGEDVSDVSY